MILFGFMAEIWLEPMIKPVCLENKYYPDRNMWVVCIIPQNRRYNLLRLESIESGFGFEQVIEYLENNLEKPVYVYEKDTFFPVYKTDVVEWNGQFGIFEGFPNHLKEGIDEKPLDGIEDLIKQAQYCVSIEEYHEENGLSDPSEMYNTPGKFFFKNLLSAKLFYNKKVANFMEITPADYTTNYNEFSQSSLSWHGWKSHMVDDFGPVRRTNHLIISIQSVSIKYNGIDGEYELI